MRILKYLAAVWAAIAIYSLFAFFYGPKGLSAYNQLLFEQERQIANLMTLGFIHEQLEETRNNLLFDYDTQLVHARRLGFGGENEQFIRIVGLENVNRTALTAGSVYLAQAPDFISLRRIKVVAFSMGLLIFAFLFTLELINRKAR